MVNEREYAEGPEALKKFEDGMRKLFKASKPESPFTPTPAKQQQNSNESSDKPRPSDS